MHENVTSIRHQKAYKGIYIYIYIYERYIYIFMKDQVMPDMYFILQWSMKCHFCFSNHLSNTSIYE